MTKIVKNVSIMCVHDELCQVYTYITVGAFIVSMMLLSALMTILYLPALITLTQGWLFKTEIR